VDVHFFAAAKAAVGRPTLSVDAGTVESVLDQVVAAHPAFAAVRPQCSFLVDGLSAGPQDQVTAGGRLDVLPPFAGG